MFVLRFPVQLMYIFDSSLLPFDQYAHYYYVAFAVTMTLYCKPYPFLIDISITCDRTFIGKKSL